MGEENARQASALERLHRTWVAGAITLGILTFLFTVFLSALDASFRGASGGANYEFWMIFATVGVVFYWYLFCRAIKLMILRKGRALGLLLVAVAVFAFGIPLFHDQLVRFLEYRVAKLDITSEDPAPAPQTILLITQSPHGGRYCGDLCRHLAYHPSAPRVLIHHLWKPPVYDPVGYEKWPLDLAKLDLKEVTTESLTAFPEPSKPIPQIGLVIAEGLFPNQFGGYLDQFRPLGIARDSISADVLMFRPRDSRVFALRSAPPVFRRLSVWTTELSRPYVLGMGRKGFYNHTMREEHALEAIAYVDQILSAPNEN